jgi:Cdc6-like AAA superfamily ATPase
MIKKYETFLKIDKDHSPSPGIEIVGKLRPDVYRVDYDYNTDSVTFVTMESNHDELVDLPGTEYESVISDVDIFLTPECQARFDAVGFLHKFNILLYGAPGTGKTCLVNRVAQKVIASGGIVLFNPTPASLKTTFAALAGIPPLR